MAFLRRKRKDTTLSNEIPDLTSLKTEVINTLRLIFDPEIPVNIYDLGLIYDIKINSEKDVHIQMTLTTPACPVAQTFPTTVETKIKELEWVNHVNVELVWDPPWTQDLMTEAAKLELGLL